MSVASDPLHRQFAANVQRLMLERGLSVNKLADFSGIGRGRLSDILAGKGSPTLRTVGRVADALGVTAAELVVSK